MKHLSDRVSDKDETFSPVPAASGFHTILSFATQFDMCTDHVNISQVCVEIELQPKTVTMEMSIFFFHPAMKRILDTFIVYSSHFTACRQSPVRGLRR